MADPDIRDDLYPLREYRAKADGCLLWGVKLTDLTRDELLAAVACFGERYTNLLLLGEPILGEPYGPSCVSEAARDR